MFCGDRIQKEVEPFELKDKELNKSIAHKPMTKQLREQIVGAFGQLYSNEEAELVLD